MKVGSAAASATTRADRRNAAFAAVACLLLGASCLGGCRKSNEMKGDAPQNLPVVQLNADQVKVDNPGRFPLAFASSREIVSKLEVTGSVSPDISKELPVLSLANGRIVALHVELGDSVKKGQLVMDVQSPDVANAFSAYLQAVSNEHLAKVTLDRDKLLISKGAIAQSQVDAAVNGEEIAVAALNATEQQLKIYGVDKNHPSDTVHVYSPTSGVVVSQNATNAAVAGVTYAGSTGSLTIADLTHVWVVVDVYENQLAQVHMGQHVEIRIAAYPNQVFDGTVSDIGATLDSTIRTGKVRIVVANPRNELRLGMFATARILGSASTPSVVVPADAILHLHDAAFVFEPSGQAGVFQRVQVKAGETLPGNVVRLEGNVRAGQQVVANALDLQNTADNQ